MSGNSFLWDLWTIPIIFVSFMAAYSVKGDTKNGWRGVLAFTVGTLAAVGLGWAAFVAIFVVQHFSADPIVSQVVKYGPMGAALGIFRRWVIRRKREKRNSPIAAQE